MDSLRQLLETDSLASPLLTLLAVLTVTLIGLAVARGLWRRQLTGPESVVGGRMAAPGAAAMRPASKAGDPAGDDEAAATRATLAEIAERAATVRAQGARDKTLTLDVRLAEDRAVIYQAPPRAPPLLGPAEPGDFAQTAAAETPGLAPAAPAVPGRSPVAVGEAASGIVGGTRSDHLPLVQKLARDLARRNVHMTGRHAQATTVGLPGYDDELTRAVRALYDHRDSATPLAGIVSVLTELEAGNSVAAEGVFRTIVEQKRRGGTAMTREAAQAARSLGAIARLRDEQTARAALEDAVTLDGWDPVAWNELGHLRRRAGQYDLARLAYERVLSLANQSGSRPAAAAAMGNLGVVALAQGNVSGAQVRFREALGLARELEDQRAEAAALGNLGLACQSLGDLSDAERNFVASLKLHEELGLFDRAAADHGRLGAVYEARDMLDEADTHLRQAVVICEEIGARQAQGSHVAALGLVRQKRGEIPAAGAAHRQALAIARELGDEEAIADQTVHLGTVARTDGDLDAACGYWRAAMAMYGTQGRVEDVDRVQSLRDDAGCPEFEPT
ncbi:MAG: tetratricopeptide repeat protein [Alphaproteobacteria bacterium]|nr:tetratricopeptide repeat protein [Alphaproteobacteria bacterium]